MRTTLDLDDDVIRAARALADHEGFTLGKAVSALIRRGLEPAPEAGSGVEHGFPIRHRRATDWVITDELVARYRDGDD